MKVSELRNLIREEIELALEGDTDQFTHAANGMHLKKAISDPASRISRLVNFIRKNGPSTKADLLQKGLGKTFSKPNDNMRYDEPDYKPSLAGYASALFGVANKNGLIKPIRQGNEVKWDLGPNAKLIPKQ